MKFPGGLDTGPFIPNTASWICWPGRMSRPTTTRLGALKPLITGPPGWPSTSGNVPSTHTSA